MDDLQKMIDSYKESADAMTEQQLAEAERSIWKAYLDESGKPPDRGGRREWFVQQFGKSAQAYEQRALMISAGTWADPLWDMLGKGTPRATVMRLFRQTRTLVAERHLGHGEALVKVLQDYEGSGTVAHTSEGKAYRRGPGRPRKNPMNGSFRSPELSDEAQNSRTKRFVAQALELADGYARVSLADCKELDQVEIAKVVEEFVSYTKEACEELRRRVMAARSDGRKAKKRQRVTRSQLRRACEVLGVSVAYGSRPDMDVIRKVHRKRAAQLHPDKHGGSVNALAEYKAVIESYGVIVEYSEELNTHGDRSHEAR